MELIRLSECVHSNTRTWREVDKIKLETKFPTITIVIILHIRLNCDCLIFRLRTFVFVEKTVEIIDSRCVFLSKSLSDNSRYNECLYPGSAHPWFLAIYGLYIHPRMKGTLPVYYATVTDLPLFFENKRFLCCFFCANCCLVIHFLFSNFGRDPLDLSHLNTVFETSNYRACVTYSLWLVG